MCEAAHLYINVYHCKRQAACKYTSLFKKERKSVKTESSGMYFFFFTTRACFDEVEVQRICFWLNAVESFIKPTCQLMASCSEEASC